MKTVVTRAKGAVGPDQLSRVSAERSKVPVSGPPDTGLLYSADDIARFAHVSKVTVFRLCLAGIMPKWREIDGRRYWDRKGAVEAVARLAHAASLAHLARRRKSA